jgi:hypothetical protein
MQVCLISGCSGSRISRGLCGKHYQRWRKHGDPHFVKPNLGNRKLRPKPVIRTCRTCGYTGPAAEFLFNRNMCRPCGSAYSASWKRANPELVAASKERTREQTVAREELRLATRKGLDGCILTTIMRLASSAVSPSDCLLLPSISSGHLRANLSHPVTCVKSYTDRPDKLRR